MINRFDNIFIKYVALYLRKSRGDSEDALIKHRNILIQLCQRNNWKYVEYLEIGTGDSIDARPVFINLLNDIRAKIYDAVCVVDIDRLGRGDLEEQGIIKKAFYKSDTYVVTPQQIYNYKDDDDEFIIDMKSFIARREYKQIVKRFSQGKKIGARLGMWTNGTPPYPYEYERWGNKYNPKGLVVNDEKYKIYRYMVESLTNNEPIVDEIAIDLNKKGIPSPKQGLWSGTTVYRILIDETHLGKIISNKTKGEGHLCKRKSDDDKVIRIPKEQWTVVNGNHESVKTLEEHLKILEIFSKRSRSKKRMPNPENIKPLTGLVKCGLCGHTMSFYSSTDRKEAIKACWYKDPYGVKCKNKGMITEHIYKFIYEDIVKYKEKLIYEITNADVNSEKEMLIEQLKEQNNFIGKKLISLQRIQVAYEDGAYTLEQYKQRKASTEKEINEIKETVKQLELRIEKFDIKDLDEKLYKIEKFLAEIGNEDLSDEEKNELYKTIIDKILWIRDNNDISIKTVFK